MENLFVKKNPLQDLLSSLNAVLSTNESTEFITGHVIYNPAYTYKYQLKTTLILIGDFLSWMVMSSGSLLTVDNARFES